jgi:23S rRNA (guanine745-N1)-methyltransferase
MSTPWRCPVCQVPLALSWDGRRWACRSGHSFDVAREGYVNFSTVGHRRTRQAGDVEQMVNARRRFLATGAFDPLTNALVEVATQESPNVLLDVGCGDGRHTRSMSADIVMGIDAAKTAAAAAARADPRGWYAVANAADLPVPDESIDLLLNVFGPIVPLEMARVVRRDGIVVAAHPRPAHLEVLRSLVFAKNTGPRPVKPPLRNAKEWFTETGTASITFPVAIPDESVLADLFAMTPYRWHAPIDIDERVAALASAGRVILADVQVTTYKRTDRRLAVG